MATVDCQNRISVFSMVGQYAIAEKLLQVNYLPLRDQCATDCILHCSEVEVPAD